MSKNAIAGNLCGFFAVVVLLAGFWLGASTLWDARTVILKVIIENPAWTVFWTASDGFVVSFAYGIRS